MSKKLFQCHKCPGEQRTKGTEPVAQNQHISEPATPKGGGGHSQLPSPPLFYVAKTKKGSKGKKERVSKQKLLKGCHQGQNIIVLTILERLEFEKCSCRPTMADNTF